MKRFLFTVQKLELSWFGKLVGSKFLFPLIHFQIFAAVYFGATWSYAIFWYVAMLVSIYLIPIVPLYLQRPVALLLTMLAIMVGPVVFPPAAGLEWFAPVFMIKLGLSHAVREEPYRPESE